MSTKIVGRNNYSVDFEHSNGAKYRGELEGCGEAFRITNADGDELTTIPTDSIGSLTEPDIKLAMSIIDREEAPAQSDDVSNQVEVSITVTINVAGKDPIVVHL